MLDFTRPILSVLKTKSRKKNSGIFPLFFIVDKIIKDWYHGAMKLQAYLKRHKLTLQEFADKSGISLATVWRYVNEKYTPSLKAIRKIRNATDGRVTERDFEW
jgi:DNA-binding XRE family transcriptional regulator